MRFTEILNQLSIQEARKHPYTDFLLSHGMRDAQSAAEKVDAFARTMHAIASDCLATLNLRGNQTNMRYHAINSDAKVYAISSGNNPVAQIQYSYDKEWKVTRAKMCIVDAEWNAKQCVYMDLVGERFGPSYEPDEQHSDIQAFLRRLMQASIDSDHQAGQLIQRIGDLQQNIQAAQDR